MRAAPAISLQSEINVTPLVDVCLVLLIIFMVVAPLVTGVAVQLPEASTADPLAKQPLRITIKADGTIYLDDVVLRGDQLASELARRRSETARPVIVRADKTLPYGEVMRVLDTCRSAGFENIGLAAQRPTTDN